MLMVDARTGYSAALDRGVNLAKNNGARLTVCAIVDTIPREMQSGVISITPRELLDIAVAEKSAWLRETVATVPSDGVSLDTEVLVGKPFIEMIRQVLRNDHDLIIKCADVGGGLREFLFSSTDMHLMRKCPCPVWIIKPSERQTYRRILAAVDQDSEQSLKDALNRQILEMSTSLARAQHSELHVAHAWDVFGEDLLRSHSLNFSEAGFDAMVEVEASARKQWLKNLVNKYGLPAGKNTANVTDVKLHVVKGDAQFVVPQVARDLSVDLVVMGTVARTGIAGFFMGNTAESILAQLDCSVLTIKPPGFVSPVRLEA
ncbi:MAG: universal stress protein [Woeseiaceae bacterium]